MPMLLNFGFVFFSLFFSLPFLEFLFTGETSGLLIRMWTNASTNYVIVIIDIRYYTFNKITRTSKGVCVFETILSLSIKNSFLDLEARERHFSPNIRKNCQISSWVVYPRKETSDDQEEVSMRCLGDAIAFKCEC